MHDRPSVSRRSVLAGVGVAALAAVAGCSGDGDSEGENTDGNNDSGSDENGGGAEATETDVSVTPTEQEIPEPEGEVVVSTTLTDTSKSWDYELEEGEMVTVLARGARENTHITGSIYGPDVGEHLDTVERGGMQATAQSDSNHRISVGTNGELDVEIHIDRS